MSFKGVRFNTQPNQAEFFGTLRKRVSEYFETNKITKHANAAMVFKTIAMLLIYLIPFGLIISGTVVNPWLNIGLWIVMGLGMAGLGLSVMHDANHGAYSSNQKVNKFIGSVMYIIGGNPANWRIQHNVLHHSFTNVDGLDEDINPAPILRFSPTKPRRPIHRYQHIYAWGLYTLMTFLWSTTKDFKQVIRYKKMGLAKTQNRSSKSILWEVISTKLVYYAIFLVLPIWLSATPWYVTLIGYSIMHLLCGFILAIVFQPAHVMPNMEFVKPTEKGTVENSWAIHELHTTSNFAPDNKLLSWYVGGLNFQVEHHLFPNICHIHYKAISKIVKETAEEYGLPYYSIPSFRKAISEHAKMLKALGQYDELPKEFAFA